VRRATPHASRRLPCFLPPLPMSVGTVSPQPVSKGQPPSGLSGSPPDSKKKLPSRRRLKNGSRSVPAWRAERRTTYVNAMPFSWTLANKALHLAVGPFATALHSPSSMCRYCLADRNSGQASSGSPRKEW